ncbi:nuclear nucleic acid-binding protein C1D [Phalaenopsis equestris]|uniref:nuclear nucleic acid-binding protein C1D n=1 Tax=Phalaenopsis equestris TaxID=78828 RepID=UPI0009E33812|nr:nuclear nucleic acid-binding protein C1D [Phalaenopsis equestris]
MGGQRSEIGDGVLPVKVLDSLRETLGCVDELKGNLERFLLLAEPDVLAELTPLQRARAFLVMAISASALFSARLRCSGICSDEHPIRTELERLSLHEDKLSKYNDWNKAPLRPSLKLNPQAATRFIEHSLPDLAPDQRKSLHNISTGKGDRTPFMTNRAKKKTKYQSFERQSARAAAQEFLEKAARELFGSNDSSVKGPLQNLESDDEDDE